jgi:hydroxymethylpyrimidine/phosphomethylpyrimidine kinase
MTAKKLSGRVLTVAGSDSSGGAGIQADIKTITSLGGYAACAITAITVQDTNGVKRVECQPPDLVHQQILAVLEDIGADCIKSGMLANVGIVEALCVALESLDKPIPLVCDPVLAATSGDELVDKAAVLHLKERLFPFASVITPNITEAELLTETKISSVDAMIEAAMLLATTGPRCVIVTGGDMAGDKVSDVVFLDGKVHLLEGSKIETTNTHGTGCTLASAIATFMAQGSAILPAIERARKYVRNAIRTAPGYGKGHGPLNHLASPDD